MKKMKFAVLAVFLLTLAFSAVFVSCGAAGANDVLVVGNGGEPQSLDPAKIQGVPETRIYFALFEGLTVYDPQTCKALPGLAESWTLSTDGLTYTFKLRAANWSDGTPITAQQVVDSWLRTLDPATASEYAYMVTMVVKGAAEYNGAGEEKDAAKLKALRDAVAIKAVDDKTFEMTLTGPTPYALDMLAHQAFAVVPLHAIEKFGTDWIKPANWVSNGPFILKEWVAQDHITVAKNDKYWDAGNVKLGSIKFLPIEDNDTLYKMFKNGEVDWDCNPPLSVIDELKLRKDYQVSPQVATYYYIFNVTKKPFDDVKVRKALTMAIDREELVNKVLKGGELVANAISPAMPGYTPAKGNPTDVAAAKALLAEAGFADGKNFPKITAIYNTSERHKLIGEWLQQQWKTNLGIDVELQNLEWKTFLDVRNKHDFTLSRAGWVGDYMDPNTFLDMFITGSGNNNGAYSNPAYDDLVKKAATQAGDERLKTLMAAEEILMTQDQAVLPLDYYVNQDLIDLNKWNGWYPNPLGNHQFKFISKK